MRSGWFWNSPQWAEFQKAYAVDHHGPPQWKSSPLATDHDFTDAFHDTGRVRAGYSAEVHHSRVIDLLEDKDVRWHGVRKSYRPLIHGALNTYEVGTHHSIAPYMGLHRAQFGHVRSDRTFEIQQEWLDQGLAVLVVAIQQHSNQAVGAAYWNCYNGCAYYGSACRTVKDVGHCLVWEGMKFLKERGIVRVELGQVTNHASQKEKDIMFFKRGFSGKDCPFTVVTKMEER
jgi:hypothetical protein